MAMEPAPGLWFKAGDIHATIERDTSASFGWLVQVWTSPITASRQWTFTRAGARHAARRGVALARRRLTRRSDRQVIH
jgi:hypothetical protein